MLAFLETYQMVRTQTQHFVQPSLVYIVTQKHVCCDSFLYGFARVKLLLWEAEKLFYRITAWLVLGKSGRKGGTHTHAKHAHMYACKHTSTYYALACMHARTYTHTHTSDYRLLTSKKGFFGDNKKSSILPFEGRLSPFGVCEAQSAP